MSEQPDHTIEDLADMIAGWAEILNEAPIPEPPEVKGMVQVWVSPRLLERIKNGEFD